MRIAPRHLVVRGTNSAARILIRRETGGDAADLELLVKKAV
jgi:hypothetical protein